MIDVSDALAKVRACSAPLSPVSVRVDDAPGRVLVEDIRSDIDSPPYNKSLMDGYAVIATDVAGGRRELQVVEQVTAGQTPKYDIQTGQATRIMTGAPLPSGADAVVPVEYTETDARRAVVRLHVDAVSAGQNTLQQATVMRRGERVFRSGREVSATDVGLLAEMGRREVTVHRKPTLAVLATGDELVPLDQTPSPGKIRNTNGPMLSAWARWSGADVTDLGIARDDARQLDQNMTRGLEADVLVLSGGVSVGVRDLVPDALARLGVQQVFHRVRLRPGKPLWFGTGKQTNRRVLVFGLPGNPASSLVCFQLFVRPAIAALAGRTDADVPVAKAVLAQSHRIRGDRPTYFPSRLHVDSRGLVAEPLPWHGSADLLSLARADGLAVFDAAKSDYEAGETVPVHVLRKGGPGGLDGT
jgi:molybdopterin molybdotransferase